MKFNQQLIEKARKGEIAILNDGTNYQLNKVTYEVDSKATLHFSLDAKYIYLSIAGNGWHGLKICNMPYHSVKDFFMPDTTIDRKESYSQYADTINNQKPRTYKVTRQQMKEIWEAAPNELSRKEIKMDAEKMFTNVFTNETEITARDIKVLLGWFKEQAPQPFVSAWPEYFYIPEGEPVLVRNSGDEEWMIAISNGSGAARTHVGMASEEYKQIIPFTKNPPK